MAKVCGIHIDQRRFHAVVVDGSLKKHKIAASMTGAIPPDEDPVEAVSSSLKEFVKENKIKVDTVGLAIDSGLAAFRNLTLPFDDRSKIEDVLKFEVEGDLPHWSIEDVIVDFLVLSTKPGVESSLLVTAIPKIRLQRQLLACEKGGLEANEAELDGTSLFNSALQAGIFDETTAQILVHVGDSSTTVVVVDGGRLTSIRAIRAGALPHLPATFEDDEEEAVEGEEVAEPDEAAIQERLEKTTARIRRELGRTVSGAQTQEQIEAIYICGHTLPGIDGESIFDVPVLPLEAVPTLEGQESNPGLTVAYGAAMRELGIDGLDPHLRRDELKFTGTFERLELPLAVFSLLLFTLLAVKLIIIEKQILWRDQGNIAKGWKGDMQIWLEHTADHLLPDPAKGLRGRLRTPPDEIVDYVDKARSGELTTTKYQQILGIRAYLDDELNRVKRQLGQIQDVKQPQSALEGMTLVMDVIDRMGDRIGRFAIRSVNAEFNQGNARRSDEVEVVLDIDFHADQLAAARAYDALVKAWESETWCVGVDKTTTKPLETSQGMSADGLSIHVNVEAASPPLDVAEPDVVEEEA